ncbi:MAG: 3'-5' exonuclease [Candidatus Omnitrophota bacterium]
MDLTKNIEDFDLVFLDLETTGLDVVTGDSLCEVGALKVRERKVINKFHSLVNPRKKMPAQAYEVHKISDEELKDAPCFEEIADRLIRFLNGCVICAYNVGFDMGFINHQLRRMGRSYLEGPAIDVLSMARDGLKLPRYNLEATAKFFNIDCSRGLHRAVGDAFVAYRIFLKLIDIFKEKRIEKLNEFISLYGLDNEIFRAGEDHKTLLFKEAMDSKTTLAIRYFSSSNRLKEEKILPLSIFQEGKYSYLLYQGEGEASCRLKLNRILKVGEPPPQIINLL